MILRDELKKVDLFRTLPDAVLDEVAAGGGVGLDRAGRGDVVGRDGVADHHQAAGALDVLDRVGLLPYRGRERRQADRPAAELLDELLAFRLAQLLHLSGQFKFMNSLATIHLNFSVIRLVIQSNLLRGIWPN